MATTRAALGGDSGDEADESTGEGGDEPVERTTHLLLPEQEAGSAGCQRRRIILMNSRPARPSGTSSSHRRAIDVGRNDASTSRLDWIR